MAKSFWSAAVGLTQSASASTTYYMPVAIGNNRLNSTEANVETYVGAAGTFSDIYIYVVSNGTTAASTLRFRKNAANGNQSVSIGSGSTGDFTDSTNTDTISSGDEVALELSVGAGGTLVFTGTSCCFDKTGNAWSVFNREQSSSLTKGTVYYRDLAGHDWGAITTESDCQVEFRTAGTLRNLRYWQGSGNSPVTVTVRINGADGNLTVSSTGTGWYSDTSSTDSVSAGDLVSYKADVGSTGSGAQATTQRVEFDSSSTSQVVVATDMANGANNITVYNPVGGSLETSRTTEAYYRWPVPFDLDASNLWVVVYSAGSSATIYLRKNGVDSTNVQVSLTGTGEFLDSSGSESFSAGDDINYRWDLTGAWGIKATSLLLAGATASVSGKITAVQADVTYTPVSARISAVQAEATYSVVSARISAVQAEATYSVVSGRISAVQADATYDLKSARISAVQAEATYSVVSARISAVQAEATYSVVSARISAVQAEATYDLKSARISAVQADATYSVVSARISAVQAEATYSQVSARISAVQADVTYTPSAVPTARITAVQAEVTYSQVSARISAVQAEATYDLKSARITAVQAEADYSVVYGRITAVQAEATYWYVGTLEQNSYRARYDNGTESTATWQAAVNTPWTQDTGVIFRVRFLVKETTAGHVDNVTLKLQYNLEGAGWNDVTGASSVVRAVDSLWFPPFATDTTQQLGVGTFLSDNDGCDHDYDGIVGGTVLDFVGSEETELEFAIKVIKADVSDGDEIQLRLVNSDDSLLTTYTETPTLTVDYPIRENVSLKLQASHNSGAYFDVTASSSVIKVVDSSYFTDGADTAQRIGSGVFLWDNNGLDDADGVSLGIDIHNSTEVEVEHALQIVDSDVTDEDTIDLRLVENDGADTLLESYVNYPQITVNKTGGVQMVALILD